MGHFCIFAADSSEIRQAASLQIPVNNFVIFMAPEGTMARPRSKSQNALKFEIRILKNETNPNLIKRK